MNCPHDPACCESSEVHDMCANDRDGKDFPHFCPCFGDELPREWIGYFAAVRDLARQDQSYAQDLMIEAEEHGYEQKELAPGCWIVRRCKRKPRALARCAHGAPRSQDCRVPGCAQRCFGQVRGGSAVVVALAYCSTCDVQIGSVPKRRGLPYRRLLDFQRRHARCGSGWLDELGWMAIALDTGEEIEGDGPITVTRDSDEKKAVLINTGT